MRIRSAKRSHTHVKEPVDHVGVRWIYGKTKITQHALKMSRVFRMLKLNTVRKKKKKKKKKKKSGCSRYVTLFRLELLSHPLAAKRNHRGR